MPPATEHRPDPEIQRIVDAARGVWIRRLIDYSRSNALLFYRERETEGGCAGQLDLARVREWPVEKQILSLTEAIR